ncbi:MAG: DinB family protein [Acidobacteriota bacterium]
MVHAHPQNPKPEQARALAYLERRGTKASTSSVRQALTEAFHTIEARLATVPAEVAAQSPPEGGWSIHEIVDHLVISHRPAICQLRDAVAGKACDEPIEAHLLSSDPWAIDWTTQQEALATVHRDILACLDGVADLHRSKVRIPTVFVIKVDDRPIEWTEPLEWKAFAMGIRVHTLEHLAQVERTLAAIRLLAS